jgi:hypothetical protein
MSGTSSVNAKNKFPYEILVWNPKRKPISKTLKKLEGKFKFKTRLQNAERVRVYGLTAYS